MPEDPKKAAAVGEESPDFERVLEGQTISKGVAIGRVHLMGYEFDRAPRARIAQQEIEGALEQFRAAVELSKEQVRSLTQKLQESLGQEELKILDVHLAYLEDPTFVDEVEVRIRRDKRSLPDALTQVVSDFERIFELVENESLKERALDLRDVALRVVRNLEDPEPDEAAPTPEGGYILVARKLSVADMLHLEHEDVLGIIAEEGGITSHGAIIARSLGVPAVSGIPDLRDSLSEGDSVILDAGTGVVYLDPDERLLREYEVRVAEPREGNPLETEGPIELGDGSRVHLYGACGNLGDVSQSLDLGLDGVGIYRTELLYVVNRTPPAEELLAHHYAEVHSRADGNRVCFRLLDAGGLLEIPGMEGDASSQSLLGRRGIRYLLSEPQLLRRQLRALLRTKEEGRIEIAVPFVTVGHDLVRVREAVREERASLIKEGIPCADEARIGAIIEVPCTAFYPQTLAHEADFLVVAIDDLQQHVFAADRDDGAVADYYSLYHPALFLLLEQIARQAKELGKGLLLFGEGAADPLRIPFYLGVGYRHFAVSPVRSAHARRVLGQWTQAAASSLAERVLAAPTSLAVQKTLLEAER